MSATIDQKAYLQKYLTGTTGIKKKKKKKVVKGQGFKIIDDDLDLTKLRALEGDELDILDDGEDAPQIAGIIDERPEEIKKMEQFKTTSKWRVINQDDGFNSKLQIEEIKKDVKEIEKENELIFGKMYSDSEDEKKNDSDHSPPRKGAKENQDNSKRQNNSDSDFSPPRKRNAESPPKKTKSNNKNYDSDFSPPRRKENQVSREKSRKQSRWEQIDDAKNRNRSPSTETRNKEQKNHKQSKQNKNSKRSSSSDLSPPRKSQRTRDSTERSSQKSKKHSPRRNRNCSPDSDLSPPRKSQKTRHSNERSPRKSRKDSPSRNRHHSPDSDLSPPRKRRELQKRNDRKHNTDHTRYESSKDSFQKDKRNKRKQESDSDMSPPRRSNREDREKSYRRNSDSPPPTNKKMARTLEGKQAGLQDAVQLRQENEMFRKREEEAFSKMTDDISGRNAKAVSRKGKRETSEDRQKQKEKADRQKELDEKYKRWNKGIKQVEAQEAKIQEYMHEASKPLARHRDDRDLEDTLKRVEREGDPMLRYIREKKVERGELPPEKPKYKGNFPPNRFNIRPGYRWDGVDRSNGYEKKYFDQQSKRKAQQEEAYKWSTEDL
ncbi:BUD13-like [Papilio machaon]|uniref:BUD13 homolog n=1 Tax=Papilio machaon TaxID=76193 RepID=A0A0N1PJF8_PAPMA|nr:BUD13-like [Papilio machaon]